MTSQPYSAGLALAIARRFILVHTQPAARNALVSLGFRDAALRMDKARAKQNRC